MIKQLILHTIVTEKRNIMTYTALMAGILLAFSTIFAGTWVDETDTLRISYSGAVSIGNTMIFICLVLSASRMARMMNNKASAVQYLMLPADNRDKFISRWIIGVVGYLAMFFAALVAADALQAVYNLGTRFTCGSLTYQFLTTASDNGDGIFSIMTGNVVSMASNIIDTVLIFLLCHSIYTLGSTVHKKHPFIKTTLWIICFFMLLSVIIGGTAIPAALSGNSYTIHFLVDPKIMAMTVIYTLIIGITVGAYWLSYRRLCRWTVE